ncbi:MAG TPA: C39 family peptidase [Candidatus Anaerofilum excrementigallinarum]|nr:C39 family peptidase [Candidatus Anaerofilum excrementigallinarum]
MKWTYRAKPSSADTSRRRRRLPSAARMALRAGWWCILLCVSFWAGRQQTAAQNPDTAFAALPACSSSEALSGSSSSSPSADSSPADPEPLAEGEVLSVPLLSQQQLGMPTGCELVSAGMLLEYYGCDLTLYQWMDNCVEFSTPWLQDGRMVNLSPWEAFIGSPWESSGYGCFAPVIRDALALALPDRQVEDLTGTSLEELEREYLSRRIPVLVWVTICMEETSEGPSWLTPEGETFTRTNNEHCMVLVGSDSDNYIFNDPYQAGGQVSYPRQLAESRYEEMGRQAVAVTG